MGVGEEEQQCDQEKRDADVIKLLQKVPRLSQTFTALERIGHGTFSQVYSARLRARPDVEEVFALKHLVPTSHPARLESELRCLRQIGGAHHVVSVLCCVRELDHVVLVMPHFPHDKFQNYLSSMTVPEIRDYVTALMTSLGHVHRHHVIHRDVKPSNWLYDRRNRRYLLVDFGLAHKVSKQSLAAADKVSKQSLAAADKVSKQSLAAADKASKQSLAAADKPNSSADNLRHEAGRKSPRRKLLTRRPSSLTDKRRSDAWCQCRELNVCHVCLNRKSQQAARAGTPGYRPPEVLLKSAHQTTALDMWAAGVILLSLLARRYPFFKAPDDMTSLAQIMTILGSEAVQRGAEAVGKVVHCEPRKPGLDLRRLCCSLRAGRELNPDSDSPPTQAQDSASRAAETEEIPEPAFDLLKRLLDPNPHTRLTADQALQHEFLVTSH